MANNFFCKGIRTIDEIRPAGFVPGILMAVSLIGVTLISAIVLTFDQTKEKYTTILVFVSLLPLFATWIGYALVYYFSSSSFMMAMSAYSKLVPPVAGQTVIPVTTVMIDKSKIDEMVTLDNPQTASGIRVKDNLLTKLSPVVTRIAVVDSKGAAVYIIHDNTLYRFITKVSIDASRGLTLDAATLQDLLADAELGPLLTNFVVVPSSFTLADAKTKIDKAPGCRDAFVTLTGKRSEPIIGWITDVRLAQFARV
jgi:hypothetical protein